MSPTTESSPEPGTAAELALRMADQAQLPVILVDPRTEAIEEVNEPFLEEFGLAEPQVRGHRCRDLIEGPDGWQIRDAVAVAAFGGSPEPVTAELRAGGDDPRTAVWHPVPNVLEDPTKPVALVCRPKGRRAAGTVDPPKFHEEENELDRIPPRERIREEKRMSETSRYLWD